jgi:chromosome partitioning protein
MEITCENCQSRYLLKDSLIRPGGSRVRCTQCRHVFMVLPAEREVSEAPAAQTEATPQPPPKPARVVAVSNQKGGVAKTSTCFNLGIALAQQGQRVLLVDFDVQANLTLLLGCQGSPTFHKLVQAPDTGPAEIIQTTRFDHLWLLPAGNEMVLLSKAYFGKPNFEMLLKEKLDRLRHGFDIILIDTPPSIEFFTLNALTAADAVIIPCQCDFLATHGVHQIVKMIGLIRSRNQVDLPYRILFTMYDPEDTVSRVIRNKMRARYPDRCFDTCIRQDPQLRASQFVGQPAHSYAATSNAGEDYLALAAEYAAGGTAS